MRCALRAATVLALAFVAAQPAASQSAPVYDLTELESPYGPLGVAFRTLAPAERTRSNYTHEIVAAHPIWGYGVYIGKYRQDCREGGGGRSASMLRWDGTQFGDTVESRMESPLYQVIGFKGEGDLLKAILCRSGPLRLATTKIGLADLQQRLGRYAGPSPAAWRMHTIKEPGTGRSMRFAAWSSESEEITGLTEFRTAWGREYGASIDRFPINPGVTARTVIDYVVANQEIGRLVSRRDIVQGSAYLLAEVVVVDDDGVSTVGRLLVCQRLPALVHHVYAEYRGIEEQQIALRFVNGLWVNCP